MRRWLIPLTLLLGVALGVSATLLAPRVAGRHLPGILRGATEVAEGEVVAKQREQDRLLLTVLTPKGAILATFKKKVAEIDMLIERGDTLMLAFSKYEPFMADPAIERVKKRTGERAPGAETPQ